MPLARFPLALLTVIRLIGVMHLIGVIPPIGVWRLLGADLPLPRVAPIYTAASIVNAADNQSGQLAPYAIGTIYGTNLAYSTAAVSPGDLQDGALPTVLLGASDTSVLIDYSPAALYYVSPTQINFLVPPDLLPGPVTVYVDVDTLRGPLIQMTLTPAAPGLFQLDSQNAVATLPDGSVLTPTSPAKPGNIVILWATGLGAVVPPVDGFELPTAAARLVAGADLSILLDGTPVDPGAIQYAGVAPGNAGLYQINLKLPLNTGNNPEIQLQLDGASSIPGVHLPVEQ
jgi:uncharacterized protein (TIGR03437 family)